MSQAKRVFILTCVLFIFAFSAFAQSTKSTSTQAAQSTSAQQPPPGTLAIVNGQAITVNDIDPQLREFASNLDKEIANARRKVLESRMSMLLYEAEAKKRKVTVAKLLETEVTSRIQPPTEEEIKAVYDANQSQLASADPQAARQQIIQYLRGQRQQRLIEEFINRLRLMYVVEQTVDVNAQNLQPNTVLATVAGTQITLDSLSEELKEAEYDLRQQVYDAQKQAVDFKINMLLLEAEAQRRKMTTDEVIRAEVTDKMRTPTDAQVASFYESHKSEIQGDLASRRADITAFLEQQERLRLEDEFARRLRANANLRIFLTEPVPYARAISTDDDPARGNAKAPVTIVMFTDFQCPACAATHQVLEEILPSFGDRVRLVVRDFPLEAHANARKAAEAANAANAQGKFFEYTALLYKNQSALDVESLKKYATQVGLDRARFDAALDKGEYAAEINKDVADGQKYVITSTPTLFINGVRLNPRDLNDRGIVAAIERALARASAPRTPGTSK